MQRDARYARNRMLRMELPGRRKRKRPKWRFINVVRASMRTVGVL